MCHGDVKPENVLVTSWGWAYISDFAPYKPVALPADNPAPFSSFFDTSGRRRAYLAPERFVDPPGGVAGAGAAPPPTELTPAMVRGLARHAARHARLSDARARAAGPALRTPHPAPRHRARAHPPTLAHPPAPPFQDIFSLGCVLAELFLEGQPLFDYSRLLAYRQGAYDPAPVLARLEPAVRDMVTHMIQVRACMGAGPMGPSASAQHPRGAALRMRVPPTWAGCALASRICCPLRQPPCPMCAPLPARPAPAPCHTHARPTPIRSATLAPA